MPNGNLAALAQAPYSRVRNGAGRPRLSEKEEDMEMDRRNFLKGAALAGVMAGSAALATGCAPQRSAGESSAGYWRDLRGGGRRGLVSCLG